MVYTIRFHFYFIRFQKDFSVQSHCYQFIDGSENLLATLRSNAANPETEYIIQIYTCICIYTLSTAISSLTAQRMIFQKDFSVQSHCYQFIDGAENLIVHIIFRLIWNQIDVHLVPNQPENGICN